jgi:hemoglobin/transferrin/lactoferrin receptor protein
MNDVESTGSAVDIRNENEIAVSDRYPASQWNSSAVYLSYQNQLNEKLLLQAGTRFAAFGIYSDFTRMLTFYPLGVEKF